MLEAADLRVEGDILPKFFATINNSIQTFPRNVPEQLPYDLDILLRVGGRDSGLSQQLAPAIVNRFHLKSISPITKHACPNLSNIYVDSTQC
jgi:hypothetical protein